MTRTENLRRLEEDPLWDLLIIGGGATGLGAALDAAARGYRTALVEQADFAQATSSRSTKLVHGGVRYLQSGNLPLVREALQERARLLANAPGLVHPLQFVIPLERWTDGFYFGAGLKLYDFLAGSHGVERSRRLPKSEMAARFPTLQPQPGHGGLLYGDGQFDDARLAVALAQTATEKGAAALNYARVTSLRRRDGRVCGALVRDEESGAELTIRARGVINATGVFTDAVRRLDEPATKASVRPSQGAHLVLPRAYLPGDTAVLIPRTADGRVLFAIPWHGRVLLGTTDTPVAEASLEPRPLPQEIEFLIGHAKRCLGWDIAPSDILSAYAGIRPLVNASGGRTASLSRDHLIQVSPSGLISIVGGKWTTYRRMAEQVVDAAAGAAGLTLQKSVTGNLALTVAVPPPQSARKPLDPALPISAEEIVRAVRAEMALRLEDVLSRRTRALILDARAAMRMAPPAAAIIAAELGRDEQWQRQEVEAFVALAQRYIV